MLTGRDRDTNPLQRLLAGPQGPTPRGRRTTRAMGATRRHIIAQFLVETTTLSGVGGILGIGLGLATVVAVGMVHSAIAGIEKPLLTPWPIVASFAMATTVGIIFGLYPAIRAAQQDPIVALRHD